MADKTENILVEFDYNNIIIVDPNKVVDEQGKVKERLVRHEDLVMYANLETKVLPRTKLAIGVANNDAIQTISVASVNFLKPGGKTFLDTAWSDELTGKDTIKGQGVNQPKQESIKNPNLDNDYYIRQTIVSNGKSGSVDNGLLGITNIQIRQNTSFMPTITMELVDVKGRALFESGDNSPYAVFFNLPYPTFYLTIKGYYGKAVRLALMLNKFNSRYDTSTGNFKIDLTFYTYKYTILSELSMAYLVAAPHMYKSRVKIQATSGGPNQTTNVNDTIVERGYQKVKEMYSEYKSKGLIPDDFPEITLVQMKERIENFIKNKLDTFTKSNLDPITNCDDYQKKLQDFQSDIYYFNSGSWFNKYLDKKNYYVLKDKSKSKIYTFKKEINTPESRQKAISELESLIIKYKEPLESNPTVGLNGKYVIEGKEKKVSIQFPIKYDTFNVKNIGVNDIDLVETYRQINGKEPTSGQTDELKAELTKTFVFNSGSFKLKDGVQTQVFNFYFFEGPGSFIDQTDQMGKSLKTIREQIEQELTNSLANFLTNKNSGIGFVPNIRNVLAVVFANGEAFLRMMDDVHTQAWDLRDDRIRKDVILDKQIAGASQDAINSGESSKTPIYPWPQLIVETTGERGQEKYEIRYPGDSSILNRTKAFLFDVWPEVEFVEEFIKGYVERTTPPADPTDSTNSVLEPQRISFNAIEFPVGNYVYNNKEEVKFFYEIMERIIFISFYSKLSRANKNSSEADKISNVIAEAEMNNLLKALGNSNPFIVQKLKNYNFNSSSFEPILRQFSNSGLGESWQNYIRGIFNTKYIKNTIDNASFEFLNTFLFTTPTTIPQLSVDTESKLKDYIDNSTTSNSIDFTDTFPFTNLNWSRKYMANSGSFLDISSLFNTNKTLKYNTTRKVITNFLDNVDGSTIVPFTNFLQLNNQQPDYSDLKTFYINRTSDKQIYTEGNVKYVNYSGNVNSVQTTSIFNTPYFVKAIQEGVKKFREYDPYPFTSAAYLFLNSLPLSTTREKYIKLENEQRTDLDYIFATFKKFGAIHNVPYAWLLKLGSIWYRYKKYIEDGVDILDNVWSDIDYNAIFDPVTSAATKTYYLTINGAQIDIVLEDNNQIGVETSSLINLGFYPKLINDFNVFYQGFEIIKGTTQINGTCNIVGTQLFVTDINLNQLQVGNTIVGANIQPNTTIVSQTNGTPGGVGEYVVSISQNSSAGLFYVSNLPTNGFTTSSIQNAFLSGLTLNYSSEALINLGENFDPNNPNRDLRIIPWSVTINTLDKKFSYVIPSCGSLVNQTKDECFNNSSSTQNARLKIEITGNTAMYNGSVRTYWGAPNFGYFDSTRVIKPQPDEYVKQILSGQTIQDNYSLNGENGSYTKISELLSVFDKNTLDGFEKLFLDFSKSVYDLTDPTESNIVEKGDGEFSSEFNNSVSNTISNSSLPSDNLNKNFQYLMRELMKTPVFTGQTGDEVISQMQQFQFVYVQEQIEKFIGGLVIFKNGNPSDFDRRLFYSFSNLGLTDPYTWDNYTTTTPGVLPINVNNVPLSLQPAWKALRTYVGFSEIPELSYKPSGSYITDFFIDFNMAFTEENIIRFAPIIKIYVTQKLNQFQSNFIAPPSQPNNTPVTTVGVTSLIDNSLVQIQQLVTQFRATFTDKNGILTFEGQYQTPPISANTYSETGSTIYFQTLTNQVISAISGVTTPTQINALIVSQEFVTPSSYTPSPNIVNPASKNAFTDAMTNFIDEVTNFRDKIIDNLMIKLRSKLDDITINPEEQIQSNLEGPQTKVELWETFKALNDKWIAGNDFKTKTLFEDVLLLDRASRNIGDKILVDIFQLKNLLMNIPDKASMLSFVQTILVENHFIVMNIPSYVNFYNVQDVVKNPKPRMEGTLQFANTLFGTYLNVDYRESSAKMVCFYGGKPSEQLDMKNNVDFRFRNDAFDLRRASDNPLVENQIGKNDWDKSNKVVGFSVDVGPQNQGVFTSFNIGQNGGLATAESLEILNQMANQGGNRGGATQSTSLYNLYKNRSYTCKIDMMGNAMMQPTMYFNLRNVPMFSGPYMITEVNHSISQGNFNTSVTGVRQPTASLPKIDNYLQSLKTNLLKTIIEKSKQEKDAQTKQTSANVLSQSTQTYNDNTSTPANSVSQNQTCTAITQYNTFTSTTPTRSKITFQQAVNMIVSKTNDIRLRQSIFAKMYLSSKADNGFEAYGNNFIGISLDQPWNDNPYFASKKFFCSSDNRPFVVFDTFENTINFIVARWGSRISATPTNQLAIDDVEQITKFVVINSNSSQDVGTSSYNQLVQNKQIDNIKQQVQIAINNYNAIVG